MDGQWQYRTPFEVIELAQIVPFSLSSFRRAAAYIPRETRNISTARPRDAPPSRAVSFPTERCRVPKKPDHTEQLKQLHLQLREALRHCHNLLERTEQMIRFSKEEK